MITEIDEASARGSMILKYGFRGEGNAQKDLSAVRYSFFNVAVRVRQYKCRRHL